MKTANTTTETAPLTLPPFTLDMKKLVKWATGKTGEPEQGCNPLPYLPPFTPEEAAKAAEYLESEEAPPETGGGAGAGECCSPEQSDIAPGECCSPEQSDIAPGVYVDETAFSDGISVEEWDAGFRLDRLGNKVKLDAPAMDAKDTSFKDAPARDKGEDCEFDSKEDFIDYVSRQVPGGRRERIAMAWWEAVGKNRWPSREDEGDDDGEEEGEEEEDGEENEDDAEIRWFIPDSVEKEMAEAYAAKYEGKEGKRKYRRYKTEDEKRPVCLYMRGKFTCIQFGRWIKNDKGARECGFTSQEAAMQVAANLGATHCVLPSGKVSCIVKKRGRKSASGVKLGKGGEGLAAMRPDGEFREFADRWLDLVEVGGGAWKTCPDLCEAEAGGWMFVSRADAVRAAMRAGYTRARVMPIKGKTRKKKLASIQKEEVKFTRIQREAAMKIDA